MREVKLKPIGVLRTPYTQRKDIPRHGGTRLGILGTAQIYPEFRGGLAGLEGFSHAWFIFLFHYSSTPRLVVRPPFSNAGEQGVFATRSPDRPNPLGLSAVRLKGVFADRIEFGEVDMLDGSPLLDIKPFIPYTDPDNPLRLGWLEDRGEDND